MAKSAALKKTKIKNFSVNNIDMEFAAPRIPPEVKAEAKGKPGFKWTNEENGRSYTLSPSGRWVRADKESKPTKTRTKKPQEAPLKQKAPPAEAAAPAPAPKKQRVPRAPRASKPTAPAEPQTPASLGEKFNKMMANPKTAKEAENLIAEHGSDKLKSRFALARDTKDPQQVQKLVEVATAMNPKLKEALEAHKGAPAPRKPRATKNAPVEEVTPSKSTFEADNTTKNAPRGRWTGKGTKDQPVEKPKTPGKKTGSGVGFNKTRERLQAQQKQSNSKSSEALASRGSKITPESLVNSNAQSPEELLDLINTSKNDLDAADKEAESIQNDLGQLKDEVTNSFDRLQKQAADGVKQADSLLIPEKQQEPEPAPKKKSIKDLLSKAGVKPEPELAPDEEDEMDDPSIKEEVPLEDGDDNIEPKSAGITPPKSGGKSRFDKIVDNLDQSNKKEDEITQKALGIAAKMAGPYIDALTKAGVDTTPTPAPRPIESKKEGEPQVGKKRPGKSRFNSLIDDIEDLDKKETTNQARALGVAAQMADTTQKLNSKQKAPAAAAAKKAPKLSAAQSKLADYLSEKFENGDWPEGVTESSLPGKAKKSFRLLIQKGVLVPVGKSSWDGSTMYGFEKPASDSEPAKNTTTNVTPDSGSQNQKALDSEVEVPDGWKPSSAPKTESPKDTFDSFLKGNDDVDPSKLDRNEVKDYYNLLRDSRPTPGSADYKTMSRVKKLMGQMQKK